MPLDAELPRFDRDQIHREDLRRLSDLLRDLQRCFADNFREGGQAPTAPFPVLDTFPALVRSDGGSPGIPAYTDNVRFYVSRAATKEGLRAADPYDAAAESIPGFSAIHTATNLAALAPGGNPLPIPEGTVVHCFRLANRGTSGTGGMSQGSGYSTPSQSLYVFWWQPGPLVVKVAVHSVTDPSGKYASSTIETGPANGAPPAGMTDGRSCVVYNGAESAFASVAGNGVHLLPAGSCYPGTLIGTDPATGNPIVFIWALPPGYTLEVPVTKDGGADGTAGATPTANTWTYTVKDPAGAHTLGQNVAPTWRRQLGPAVAGARGLVRWDAVGNLVLLDVDDQIKAGSCE